MPVCTVAAPLTTNAGDIGISPAVPSLLEEALGGVQAMPAWRPLLRKLPDGLVYAPPDDVVDEDFKCSVCLGWPIDPVILNCPAGHMLCRGCAGQLGDRLCPLDRASFTRTSPAQRPILARLDRLKVFCPHAVAGCQWVGERGDLLEHCAGRCEAALEECAECGARVRRRERGGHLHALKVGDTVTWTASSGEVERSSLGQVLAVAPTGSPVTVRFAAATQDVPREELQKVFLKAACEGAGNGQAKKRSAENAAEQREAVINGVLDIYEQAERLNVCFVVDCTCSMGPHIRAVKQQICEIVREMSARLPSMQLHLAFVGYRDHCSPVRFEILPFTTAVDEFRNFLAGVGVMNGGDFPEDVLGGLNQALQLEWGVGGAATRVLIHIGDAPCHGKRYHRLGSEHYPNGDPYGLEPVMLLRALQELDVQYVFGRITQHTDEMIAIFDQEAGGNYIQTRAMHDTRLVADAVTASLHTSVATTVSTLSAALGGSHSQVQTSDEIPDWRSVPMMQVQLHRCAPVRDLADLLPDASASATRRFEVSEEVSVQIAPIAFSQGETRTAHHARLAPDGSAVVAKHMKGVGRSQPQDAEDEGEVEDEPVLEAQLALSEVSAVACALAERFSADRQQGSKKIAFLESHAALPNGEGAPFNLEDALPAAEFRRFSNNIGWWEADADRLLMEFTRWTHEATGCHMMVVDLQGVCTEDGWLLTDPCILCSDITRFGSGNLGPRAMQRCLAALASRLDRTAIDAAQEQEAPNVTQAPLNVMQTVGPWSSWAPPGCNGLVPFEAEKLRWRGEEGTGTEPLAEQSSRATAEGAVGAIPNVSIGLASVAASMASLGQRAASALPGALRRGAPPTFQEASLASLAGNATPNSQEAAVASLASGATLDLDALLSGLLVAPSSACRSARPPSETALKQLLQAARNGFLAQSPLLELEAPMKILGDIHGQFQDLLQFLELGGLPPDTNYLCLGDYVDRGKQSIETMAVLLALKVKYPENIFLLRGNHECASITRIYGFFDECKRKYNIKLWKMFTDVFNCLPVAAVIDEKIFCCHGGPSPELRSFDDVRRMRRPADVPDTGLMCDLLWADPDKDIAGWSENDRGVSYTFGPDVADAFLKRLDLDLIARAHQVVEDGYEFFAQRRLVTVFSAPNYCGEFDNAAAMMDVKEDLECSFRIVKPGPKTGRR
mmetsp:Transcript_9844/g.20890  ORF Transcript_9844/g.20890 Transcript_9844/m.20890 type:complete len:1184 (+) Transcript_9844:71-3622(+)